MQKFQPKFTEEQKRELLEVHPWIQKGGLPGAVTNSVCFNGYFFFQYKSINFYLRLKSTWITELEHSEPYLQCNPNHVFAESSCIVFNWAYSQVCVHKISNIVWETLLKFMLLGISSNVSNYKMPLRKEMWVTFFLVFLKECIYCEENVNSRLYAQDEEEIHKMELNEMNEAIGGE